MIITITITITICDENTNNNNNNDSNAEPQRPAPDELLPQRRLAARLGRHCVYNK